MMRLFVRPILGKTMLSVENVTTFYGKSQALFGVSLDVHHGEVVTLLGRNGMGKTTTLHSIMGLTRATAGSIEFMGRSVTREPSFRIGRLGLGLVPEGRQIFPNLTARENLLATASNRHRRSSAWTLERVLEMFPLLRERLDFMGNLLSGGEQQMLAIGRALMTNPQLLILDDATEGIAPLVRAEIWRCLRELKESGLALLIVDKNISDLVKFADRHYVLEKGSVVWDGTTHELAENPSLQSRYLGV